MRAIAIIRTANGQTEHRLPDELIKKNEEGKRLQVAWPDYIVLNEQRYRQSAPFDSTRTNGDRVQGYLFSSTTPRASDFGLTEVKADKADGDAWVDVVNTKGYSSFDLVVGATACEEVK